MKLDLSKCRIRTPTPDALLPLYEMLKEAFVSDRPVFNEMVQKDKRYYTWTPYTLYLGEEVLGNVSLVPMRIWLEEEMAQIVGIASVATAKQYRNRGLAKHLMRHCLEIVDREKKPCVLLTDLPAVYEGLGFRVITQTCRTARARRMSFATKGFERQLLDTLAEGQIERMAQLYAQEHPHYDGAVVRDPDYWQLYQMLVNLYPKPRIVFCTDRGRAVGYGRFELEDDRLLVCEICGRQSADEVTEALLGFAADCALEAGLDLVSFALPLDHFAWRTLNRRGVPLEPEPAGACRETFMVRPAKGRPLGPLEQLQWSLADKF